MVSGILGCRMPKISKDFCSTNGYSGAKFEARFSCRDLRQIFEVTRGQGVAKIDTSLGAALSRICLERELLMF